MEFKFGLEELAQIAGLNTPELIAKRILEMRSDLEVGDWYDNDSRLRIEKEIAAEEDKLLSLVIAGKTALSSEARGR